MTTDPEKKMSLEEFAAAIDAQAGTLPVREAETPRTVRVRIAVAIDAAGNYYALGYTGVGVENTMAVARDCVGTPSAEVIVEADVPVPQNVTIRGEVAT